MVRVQKLVSGQLVITIPKRIAEYEGLGKGAVLEFRKHAEGILVVKKEFDKGAKNNKRYSDGRAGTKGGGR